MSHVITPAHVDAEFETRRQRVLDALTIELNAKLMLSNPDQCEIVIDTHGIDDDLRLEFCELVRDSGWSASPTSHRTREGDFAGWDLAVHGRTVWSK